jgi:predicted RNase H-like HicB family nuclease
MPETQQIDFKLAVSVKKRRKWYLAVCPILDLAAQGSTPERAVASLRNAVRGFVADCFERGVLDEVMKKAGFGPPASRGTAIPERRKTRHGGSRIRFVRVPLPLLNRGRRSFQQA